MLEDAGESREDLMASKAELKAETKVLQKQLAAYSDNDPTELERKCKEVEGFKKDAEVYTDDIYSMEGWFRSVGQDGEGMLRLRTMCYGDELDPEDNVLKDLA